MKKTIFILMAIGCVSALWAQTPGLYTLPISTPTSPYYAVNTIIRNYNSEYNIIMSHGVYANPYCYDGYTYENRSHAKSSFYLQEIATGNLTHIVTLGCHYKVNDVCFVTLRKEDEHYTPEVFCCFCGTYYSDTLDDDEPEIIGNGFLYARYGFAGFFSMDDALSPSTSCTAKTRFVEGTRQLNKMVGYSEYHGEYYGYQFAYIDNAVLDIVGIPKYPAPSCMARVKFYPEYPVYYYSSGTHWDNNIRYNSTSQEFMTDIVDTPDEIITASHPAGDSTVIWLRHSPKEMYLHSGGLELNILVYQLNLNTLVLDDWSPYQYYGQLFWKKYRLCKIGNKRYALSFFFTPEDYTDYGLVLNQYDMSNGLSLMEGRYLKDNYLPGDIAYLSMRHEFAVILDEYGGAGNKTALMPIDHVSLYPYQCLMIEGNPMKYTSSAISLNNVYLGYEILHWGGLNNTGNDDSWFANQIANNCWNDIICMKTNIDITTDATIEHEEIEETFPIKHRYYDDQYKYYVSLVHFDPFDLEPMVFCNENMIGPEE